MVKFGDNDAYIINDIDLKNKIIDYIFNVINPSKYKYNILDTTQQLNFLKNNEHYVSPNFKGYNYFLIFNKFQGNPQSKDFFSQCIAVDKKNLSYNKKTIDIKKVFMFKIKVMASQSIFRGTIFDTKLIKNIMLVKDCYHVMGNNLTEMNMIEKMLYLDTILANQFQKDGCLNFKLKINKLYKYDMLEQIINKIIPNCELDITGLVFYPVISGVSYIFNDKKQPDKIGITTNNMEETEIVKSSTYDMIHQMTEFLCSRKYSYETDGVKKVLYVEPTNITDVFNIYEMNERIGIAHIPSLKISSYCRDNIKEKTKCLCILNKQFNKWIPLKIEK